MFFTINANEQRIFFSHLKNRNVLLAIQENIAYLCDAIKRYKSHFHSNSLLLLFKTQQNRLKSCFIINNSRINNSVQLFAVTILKLPEQATIKVQFQ